MKTKKKQDIKKRKNTPHYQRQNINKDKTLIRNETK